MELVDPTNRGSTCLDRELSAPAWVAKLLEVDATTNPSALAPHRGSAAYRHLGAEKSAGLLSAAFVLLWSTGYPAARIALDHSGPFTFLVLRFGGAGLIFAALAALSRADWPRGRTGLHSILTGLLVLGLQFGALYWAASQGVSVGLIALVIGTMPIVTSLIGHLLFGEAVRPLHWIGFALGFAGVALAVGESATSGWRGGPGAHVAVLIGLLAISAGTLYQKHRASNVDPRSGLALQHLAAMALLLPFAVHEGFHADISAAFLASLGWVIGVNSLTAFALFFVLLRRGMVSEVTALFFLMPPVTAVIDYLVLGEALSGYKVAGLALAALGVYVATRVPAEAAGTTGGRVRLHDGREVLIRRIRAGDLHALARFFAVLSPASRRQRFHGTMKEVPERLLREFTQPDPHEHVGLIAEAQTGLPREPPLLVGEARFVRARGSDAAEFALVVADDWRRVGLGSSLLRALLSHARSDGVQRLCGDALVDNEVTRSFLRSLGAQRSGGVERGETIRLCLSAPRMRCPGAAP
ncbi:MAG TPA: GNAT family N-acetyltransferase [Steroidobacteraceae bacterium]|nr:GNAT family N-acetyltransferase [Steroidobacteraceae bacterium]